MPYIVVILLIVGADQLSKALIHLKLTPGESLSLLPFVRLTYVHNVGAAFGLFANYRWLFIFLGILVIILVWYFRELIGKQSAFVRWGITLALGGTIGNLIDRIRLGKVVDFIDTPIFPIFNVADMTIVIGVALLFWEVLINDRKAKGR